jgi:hypothetical protein
MRIYKYPLCVSGDAVHARIKVQMPIAAEIVKVGLQDESVYLWAEVSTNVPSETRVFAVVTTGEDFPPRGEYVGTFEQLGGKLQWHVIEVKGDYHRG